jgi:hypothetical protein
MIIGQRNVDNDKTNEILALPSLLEPLDIAGQVEPPPEHRSPRLRSGCGETVAFRS